MRDVDIINLINQAVGVAVQRAIRSVTTPRCLFGTVVAVNLVGPGIHEVTIDGDDNAVPATNMSGFALAVGSRVAILAAPPHQFWIIGNIGKCVQSGTVTTDFGGGFAVVFTVVFPFPFGGTPEVMGSVSGATTTVAFGIRTNLVSPTQFDVRLETVDGTGAGVMNFQWIAVGPPTA